MIQDDAENIQSVTIYSVKSHVTSLVSGIESVVEPSPQESIRKMLIDGTLYILTPDGAIFSAQGVQVK